MTDRIDIINPLEVSAPESQSKDAYIAGVVNRLQRDINATSGITEYVSESNVETLAKKSTEEIPAEAYGPKLVSIGRKSSSVDTLSRVQPQTATVSLGLDVLDIPPSSTGIKLVELRANAMNAKKSLKRNELALAA